MSHLKMSHLNTDEKKFGDVNVWQILHLLALYTSKRWKPDKEGLYWFLLLQIHVYTFLHEDYEVLDGEGERVSRERIEWKTLTRKMEKVANFYQNKKDGYPNPPKGCGYRFFCFKNRNRRRRAHIDILLRSYHLYENAMKVVCGVGMTLRIEDSLRSQHHLLWKILSHKEFGGDSEVVQSLSPMFPLIWGYAIPDIASVMGVSGIKKYVLHILKYCESNGLV
jgi:hypothetical protein